MRAMWKANQPRSQTEKVAKLAPMELWSERELRLLHLLLLLQLRVNPRLHLHLQPTLHLQLLLNQHQHLQLRQLQAHLLPQHLSHLPLSLLLRQLLYLPQRQQQSQHLHLFLKLLQYQLLLLLLLRHLHLLQPQQPLHLPAQLPLHLPAGGTHLVDTVLDSGNPVILPAQIVREEEELNASNAPNF